MSPRYPKDFTPDLRRLKTWPSMKGSFWRQPYLIELTYQENFRLVKESIQGKNLKILEVGCGTGFMSLELARMGHEVTGIDSNKKLIRVAKRTMRTDPYRKKRRVIIYDAVDFNDWQYVPGTYDVVLFSRVLHDMPHPSSVLSRARNLLKDGGRIVCLEYAYDLMDRRTAIWLYQIQRFLEVAGWYPSGRKLDDPREGVDYVMEANYKKRTQHINGFEEMRRPLEKLFHRERLSWHPYYCWDIITDMRIPDERMEKSFANMLKRTEDFLIQSREIRPGLFRFVGMKSD